MAVPLSHKTLFVLDHSPAFLQSSKVVVEYDIFNKARPGVIPLAPITKTLWTCAVEAVVEYCRIVYDIFATDKLIRFVLSDPKLPAFPASWNQDAQGLDQVMAHLAEHGSPSSSCDQDDCSITAAIAKAIATLCEPTERQQRRTPDAGEAATTETDLSNGGRIVCITNCKSKAQIKMIEESMSDAFVRHNKIAAESHSLLPISQLEFVLIHTMPLEDETGVMDKRRREVVPAAVNSEVIVVRTGRYIAAKLAFLVQLHYDLASTTVTGIPMKEEQNANTSANYDVELLHPKQAHAELRKIGYLEGVMAAREGIPYETVTLKWCTPRSNVVELQHCTSSFRISPMDVNSRPSSCLTNFLLAGRSVMLEQPRKSGVKVLSHMLTSHGGQVFIHTLNTSRSPLEDPPSISEGCGGRVTDYRITDFGDFMKDSRLAPVEADAQQQQQQQQQEEEEDVEMKPVRKAKAQLERMTRFWPMVIGETVIFNILSHLDPLPSLITKEVLDEEDVVDCKKAIYHMVAMEQRNETLAIPMIGTRGKAHKREEQYRQMWSELDTLVKAHAENSPGHQQVLECLLENKQTSDGVTSSSSAAAAGAAAGGKGGRSPHGSCKSPSVEKMKEEKKDGEMGELEKSWKDVEKYQGLTEREKQDFNKGGGVGGGGEVMADSPLSPPLMRSSRSSEPALSFRTKGQNLMLMWTNRLNVISASRHCEFEGRLNASGSQAKLYQNLQVKVTPKEEEKPRFPDAAKRSGSPAGFTKRLKIS